MTTRTNRNVTLNRLRRRKGKKPLQKSPYVFNNFDTFNAVFLINTDDPAFFNTTLSRELGIFRDHFQFGEKGIRGLIHNAFKYSFMKADEKAS